jgi:inhibitor of cysteine peptidase
MQRIALLVAAMVAMVLGGVGVAEAGLCAKCRELMFVDSGGKCTACGADTASAALKLCPKCSAAQHKCEHCGATITDADIAATDQPSAPPPANDSSSEKPAGEKPAPETPSAPGDKPLTWRPRAEASTVAKPATDQPPAELPAGDPSSAGPTPIEKLPDAKSADDTASGSLSTPARIDPMRSGTYASGKWQYRLEITEPGARTEGRWGWLWYNGQKLPAGEANDYYRTPWGPIYWSGAPQTRWGMHGWMLSPVAQNGRQGQALPLPAAGRQTAAATPSPQTPQPAAPASTPSQPAASRPPTAGPQRPQTLELTKVHNGQRAKVYVGNIIIVRLPGNPTTGYQWQAVPTANPVVRLMSQPQYVATPQSRGVAGGGGTFVFMFQVIQPGMGAIRLVYSRPWERNRQPVDSFGVSVEVLSTRPTTGVAQPSQSARPGYGVGVGQY